jgi:predicted DNA-binding transcriptional regulator AlpA
MAATDPGGGNGSTGSVAEPPSHVRQSSSKLVKARLSSTALAKHRLASPECAAMDEDKLLSRKELAAALGVSTRTVDRWIHEQTGPPATLLPSGRRRWRWGDVEAWLRQRREDR